MEAIPLCIPDNFDWDHQSSEVRVRKDNCRRRLTVCQEAIDFLKSIKKPVVVICIIGPARSGKSFFLSQLQQNVNFKVGNSNVSKTVGIWIGSNREIVMKEGEETEIVLLDCEGTGAISATDDFSTREWDTKLMTLAMLSSSFFIYNSKECPNAVDLENLQFVSNFSNVILQNFDNSENIRAWSDIDFFWLLRDVKIEPEVDGESCDWGKFLTDEVLSQIREFSEEHSSSNRIKKAITRTFSTLDAYGIETPSANPKVLRNLTKLCKEHDSLSEFRKEIESIGKTIITNAKVKTFKGCRLTGYDLANWVQEFVKELNKEEKSLDVNSLWQITYAAKVAHEMYCNEMRKADLPCSNQVIEDLHSEVNQRALETFRSMTQITSPSSAVEKGAQLEKDLADMLISIRSKNEKATHDHCRSVIGNLKKKYISQIDDDEQETLESMYTSIASFFQELDNSVKGDICVIAKERKKVEAEINHIALQVEESVKNITRENCIRKYYESMSRLNLPCREEDLMKYHTKHSNEAIETYAKRVTGSKTLDLNSAKGILKEELEEMKRDIENQNRNKSFSQCQQLISDLKANHIQPMIDTLENWTFKDLQEKQNKVVELYHNRAKGPCASEIGKQAISDITNTIQKFQKEMAIQAKRKANEIFERDIRLNVEQHMPCSEQILISNFDSAVERALNVFDNRTECMESNIVQPRRGSLKSTFQKKITWLKNYNFDQSYVYCKDLITLLDEKHFQKETASFAELMCSDLTNAYNLILEQYDLEAKGPAKSTVRDEAEKELNEKIRRIRRKKYLIQGGVFLTTGLVGSGLFNAGVRISKAIRRT